MRVNWLKFTIVVGSLTAMAIGAKIESGAIPKVIIGAALYAAGNAAISYLMNPYRYGEENNSVREQKQNQLNPGVQNSDTSTDRRDQ